MQTFVFDRQDQDPYSKTSKSKFETKDFKIFRNSVEMENFEQNNVTSLLEHIIIPIFEHITIIYSVCYNAI